MSCSSFRYTKKCAGLVGWRGEPARLAEAHLRAADSPHYPEIPKETARWPNGPWQRPRNADDRSVNLSGAVGFRQSVPSRNSQPAGDDGDHTGYVQQLRWGARPRHPHFHRLWARHDAGPRRGASLRIDHPQVGPIRLDREKLSVSGTDGAVSSSTTQVCGEDAVIGMENAGHLNVEEWGVAGDQLIERLVRMLTASALPIKDRNTLEDARDRDVGDGPVWLASDHTW